MFPQSLMRLYDGVGGVFRTNPTPPGTERLRFSLSADIADSDIAGLAQALETVNRNRQ